MSADRNRPEAATQDGGAFVTTRWSLVLAAGNSESQAARPALETLCRTYWLPIYAFLRRAGHSAEDARDLTQSFFVHLLTSATFANAEANRGRFRSYLLGALKHFLADEQDRQRAQKRGGGSQLLSLDEAAAEINYAWEPADDRTPDQLFERRWALAVMARALDRLREECSLAGKAALFNQLKGFLTESTAPATYPESARALGMTEANVRMTITRLRRRYGELVRAEVTHTVGSHQDAADEMRHLLEVLRRPWPDPTG